MTREEIKELLPIMQAFAEGKAIQFRKKGTSEWVDFYEDDLRVSSAYYYRIKSEPKYRPFKSQEECWNEMLKHQPFGWVKSPRGELFCIDKVFEEGIVYKHSSCHFNEYLEGQYSFVDGTPFGIKEE